MNALLPPKHRCGLRKFLLPLALAGAALPLLHAEIAFDSAASTAGTNLTTVNWSHTVGSGDDRMLVVGLALEDTASSALVVSSITYGGVTMQPVPDSIASSGSSTINQSRLFYLPSPTTGTADIAITFGGAVNGVSVGSISLSGVDTSAVPGAATAATDTGKIISASVTVATDTSWLVDVVGSSGSNVTFTAGAGQSERWDQPQSNSGGAASTMSVATAGTVTPGWTVSSSGRSAHSVAVFLPSGGPPPSAPTITLQPTDQSVIVGDAVSFTVAAGGTEPFSYQWRKDGAAIDTGTVPTAATPQLELAAVQLADAGDYDCVVTNGLGSATSDSAILSVAATATPPSFTTQPAAQNIALGGTATFSVAVTGTAPFTYQWRHEGVAIDGADAASFTIAAVTESDAGNYDVVVTNRAASATSITALLHVILPPTITLDPANQTASLGGSATFSVEASGEGTLTYQWRHNAVAIAGATQPELALTNLLRSNAGSYDVVVTGAGGSTTSAAAILTVESPPAITTQPANQSCVVGGTATFSVLAEGSAPFTYQWRKGGAAILGATAASLTLNGLQLTDSGSNYDVVVTNDFGTATSNTATLSVTTALPYSTFDLQGFATLGTGTSGGGIIEETDATYRKCYTPEQFVQAIYDSNRTAGAVRVIEVMNDLDLGYNEVSDATRALGAFRAHATPKLHPRLIVTGVSLIDVQTKGGGLTIFSANGATIRHTCLNFKGTSNIMIRNLRFDEMWEWDEASKGDYDSNDWDFIDLSNGSTVANVWIDHCTFTKAYDGIVDMKKGTQYVTMSWCRYVGDDGATNPNSFVRQQLAALEANRSGNAFYNFLRTNGFSVDEIAQVIQGHDKCHLMGATSFDSANAVLSATFHHQWFENIWDRCVPRLRGGQVHNYNIYVDDSVAMVARRMRDAKAALLSTALQNTLNNTYSFRPFLNGTISTEGGAILVEKSAYIDCITPLRNNQTDVTNAAYTGKILAMDTVYVMHNTDGTTTEVRGNSTDDGNPLGPFQAAVIPFTWNTTDGERPYPAPPMHDPADLLRILQAGAGAGVLTWPKVNWLKTSYVDESPVITTSPADITINRGQSTTLSVVATGTEPLSYQWYQGDTGDTTTPVGTDSASYTTPNLLESAQYWVRVANTTGTVDSTTATVSVQETFESWAAGWGLTGSDATPEASPAGDGIPNLVKYALALDPTASVSAGLPALSLESGQAVFRFTRPTSTTGITIEVQVSTNLENWSATATTVESSTVNQETLVATLPAGEQRAFARLVVTKL